MICKAKGWLSWDLDRSLADSKTFNHFYKLVQYLSSINNTLEYYFHHHLFKKEKKEKRQGICIL